MVVMKSKVDASTTIDHSDLAVSLGNINLTSSQWADCRKRVIVEDAPVPVALGCEGSRSSGE